MKKRKVIQIWSDGKVDFSDGNSQYFLMDHEGVYYLNSKKQKVYFSEGDFI